MSTKQNAVAEQEVVGPEIPPAELFKWRVRVHESWGAWLKRARSADLTVDEKLGLLHHIFDVELGRCPEYVRDVGYAPYTELERFEFVFSVADGWADRDSLTSPEDSREESTFSFSWRRDERSRRWATSELRQLLARKAFNLLASHIFSMPGVSGEGEDKYRREEKEREWLNDFVGSRIFPLVQRLFRVERGRYGDVRHIRNLVRGEGTQSQKIAVGFLLKLPKAIWEWKAPKTSRYYGETPEEMAKREKELATIAAMHERVEASKTWVVEVLGCLGELKLLSPWLSRLNRPCVAKLHKIAMRSELSHYHHPVSKSRPVASIGEACVAGSPAAWLLTKRAVFRREKAKLLRVQNAERKEAARKAKKAEVEKRIAVAENAKANAEAELQRLKQQP